MTSPLLKLIEVVKNSLISRGMTEHEALVAISKLQGKKEPNKIKVLQETTYYEDGFIEISDVTCLTTTDKALLCSINNELHWIPHSQIHDDSEVYEINDFGSLIISEWIAKQRKII